MRILQAAILTVACGLLIAVALFALTAPNLVYLGPVGRPVGTDFVEDYGGTDPWTGEFRPYTWSWTDTAGERVTRVLGPDGYQHYRAIPIPVSFSIGILLMLPIIIGARMSRRSASKPAISNP